MNRLADNKIVFWDFDGVIKDSVDVKTQAFMKLFEAAGKDVQNKVKEHHIANGGMSRFDKLPVYLQYAGEKATDSRVQELSTKFSRLVFQNVINAPWVAGAEDYLKQNTYGQVFILVSATPVTELLAIVKELGLFDCFSFIYGAPVSKTEAINETMQILKASPQDCIMIGDAKADMDAAKANRVSFILRLHDSNTALLKDFKGITINDITGL